MKTKTDKEIDEIVTCEFFHLQNHEYLWHKALCNLLNTTKYHSAWNEFWKEINTINHVYITQNFEHLPSDWEKAFLRLLLVEDFKKYINMKNRGEL